MAKIDKSNKEIVVLETDVPDKTYHIRNINFMIHSKLAESYSIETRVLNQAVNRNIDRFPEDFMFEMSNDEFEDWRSQIVTSNSDRQGLRYAPFCFTEQGVAMLSSILNSKLAIQINIQIMRIFTRMRQLLADNAEVKLEIAEIRYTVEQIAKKQKGHDQNIELLFEYIDRLQEKEHNTVAKPRSKGEIGFKIEKSKKEN
ncbi:ORF6N domain-containing protein [Olivibacter sitiensis]|uniref:ORF6N domain-containing protein n=1 Tax=Olivibacter sitiensis TaxID=376470 RepID=UPI000423FE8E|nr:ORF6N domain-containing protein [Olivibacter sitiensis]